VLQHDEYVVKSMGWRDYALRCPTLAGKNSLIYRKFRTKMGKNTELSGWFPCSDDEPTLLGQVAFPPEPVFHRLPQVLNRHI
jgi:hypothetical protein